ncbi:MAG: NACHT domain-containing protein, partial [Chloroflexota bacterium]
LILGLTPAACQSDYVQYEVQRAQEQDKLIFPVKLEVIDEIKDLELLGLSDTQFVDFTGSAPNTWDTQFTKLLIDMQRHDVLKITNRTLRRQRDTRPHQLHQRYLKKLASQVGTLSLGNISPDVSGTVQLEDVYIDSPSNIYISVDIQDWHVVDWWLEEVRNRDEMRKGAFERWMQASETKMKRGSIREVTFSGDEGFVRKANPEGLGFDGASLEALVGDIDAMIQQYRVEHPDANPNDENRLRNIWHNGTHEHVIKLDVQNLATANNRLVVLGQPGSGKSTFVKYLVLCLAGQQIDKWTRKAELAELSQWVHGEMTPIYIELRRFVASKYFPSDAHTQPTETDLWQYIEYELLGDELAEYLDELKYDVEQGHALIILDGLDEVPYPKGQLAQRQQQLVSLANIVNNARFQYSRVIVTSRPYAYEGWQLPDFQDINITDFTDRHRLELATKLYRATGLSPDQAKDKAQALNQQLKGINPELKDRPLFLTLMATIYLKGERDGLPKRRGELYRESILLLLDRWTSSKPNTPSLIEMLGNATLADLYERLGSLAFEVHSEYGHQAETPEIDGYMLDKLLMQMGREQATDPLALYSYLNENAGVLVSLGQDNERDVFQFAHRTFQEYLAASHIAQQCFLAESYQQVYELITTKPQTWRVPCAFIGDVLADTGRKRKSNLWGLLADLLEDKPPSEREHPAWWAVWLASEIVIEHKLHLQEKLHQLTEQPIRDRLVQWLVALIEYEGLPVIERAACGRALGLLGDPRAGVGLRPNGLPDIQWGEPVPISWHPYQEDRIQLKYEYRLAQYPVTMVQFKAFLDAEDGFDQDVWWQDFPDRYRKQRMEQ